MTESNFADLLINQPVLVWSLAGGISILVIAGFLSLFLSVRQKARNKELAEKATRNKRQPVPENVATAVSELKMLAEEESSSSTITAQDGTAVSTATSTSEKSVSEKTTSSAEASNTDATEGRQALIETTSAGESEPTANEAANVAEEENELAAIFQDDVIIDPYVQALRDNLPEVTIDELLTNIRAVSKELQEKINAGHLNQV